MSQAQLKETQRLAQVGSWEWDVDNDITIWSDELYRIMGWSPNVPAPSYKEQVVIYTPKSWAFVIQHVERALTTGEPYAMELEIVRPDGGVRTISDRGVAVQNDTGHVFRLYGTVQDITERKQAEEKLLQGYAKLRQTLRGAINALSSATEIRDPYTSGHQTRVDSLASAIAKEMGFTENGVEGVEIAALVHDIGKLGIPGDILNRPTRLTAVEYMIVKTHVDVGYTILSKIDFPWPVAQMVQQHHERLDGSGYPLGLTGRDILLEAKILAVADVVDAMVSHRPYRPALGVNTALEEIGKYRGVYYDETVVDTCTKLFLAHRFAFE